MEPYSAPKIVEIGSFADFTLDNIYKVAGATDVTVIGGVSEPSVGSSVTSFS